MAELDTLFAGPWGPVLIFGLRIIDVSLSTLRILLVVRNRRLLVPFIGFIEVLIWIFAVGNAIRNLSSGWHVLGYAAGFSAGTMVGPWFEAKLAIGLATMRIISRHAGVELAESLRALGCGVTEFVGQGREGRVEMLYTVVPRRRIPDVFAEVERWDPEAFISVEEPREIRKGWLVPSPLLRLTPALRVSALMRRAGLLSEETRGTETVH
jgi:uncharacterized protein YebE (UPF0316 family)